MTEQIAHKTTDPRVIEWLTNFRAMQDAADAKMIALPGAFTEMFGPRADGVKRSLVRFFRHGSDLIIHGVIAEGSDLADPPEGTRFEGKNVMVGRRTTKIGKAYAALISQHSSRNVAAGARAVGFADEFTVPGFRQWGDIFLDEDTGTVFQVAGVRDGTESAVLAIIERSGVPGSARNCRSSTPRRSAATRPGSSCGPASRRTHRASLSPKGQHRAAPHEHWWKLWVEVACLGSSGRRWSPG
ncbi:hypothetical protein [Leucobacter sp. cx-169]|uniref:hypothetical protein n=1 Tax=Leucobacter sp. cx-169 TaxID=2770549 RepID=UPI00165DA83F|nr:hypothetical protein [Leucobacter sp. cx-169]MBC9927179.1 hypothetical protein [Leucobacter sp. cx-169]